MGRFLGTVYAISYGLMSCKNQSVEISRPRFSLAAQKARWPVAVN